MGKEAQERVESQGAEKQGSAPFLTEKRRREPGSVDAAALCALAGAMLLWSGTFIAMKVVLTVFHPVFMVFVRMSISVAVLLPFLRRWSVRTPYARGDWRIVGFMVLCEPCLYFLFEAYALRYTTASQAGLITALLPLLVGVAAFFILKERLEKKVWLGFFLAVAGVMVLTLAGEESETAPNPMLGNLLEFMAMFVACGYTLCVRVLKGYPPFFLSAMQAVAGMLFFGVLLVVLGLPLPDAMPGAGPLLALFFLSFSTIVAYGLYNTGIARLSAGQAAAWINLIPALTLIMGIVLLDERLSLLQGLAVAPILLGVLLTVRSGGLGN